MKSFVKLLIPTFLWEKMKLLQFFYVQRVVGFTIPDRPHFDEESTPYFEALLRDANSYVEFGSGGSTVLAAKMGKSFVSIDSDPYFLSAVEKKIGGTNSNQKLISVDIGLTGPWGVPVSDKKTPDRKTKWAKYPTAPWGPLAPDLVLVDGRFRVACALMCIKLFPEASWTILLDDYQERPEYWIVEKFAHLEMMVARMAVFKPRAHDRKQLQAALDLYLEDWR